MTETELTLVDLRPQIKAALEGMETELPFQVRQSWPRAGVAGTVITYAEAENRSTDCSVVDELRYELSVWTPERDTAKTLAEEVNRTMLNMGLKRLSMGEVLEDGTFRRCRLVFGTRVDKRWMRAVE